MRGGERLLQHADDRHDAGHRALEAQLDARARARIAHSSSPCWESSCLLARDDVLARAHRPQHVLARGLDAADQLDDQVRAVQDLLEVAPRAGEHAAELGRRPVIARDRVGALGEQRLERGADGAVAEQADPKRLVACRSS